MPPETPILPMMARIRSFAVTPFGSSLTTLIAKVFGRRCSRHCVASTWPTSVVPMPKARAPNAPCVEVWRVAADDGLARLRDAELGPDDVHDAAAAVLQVEQLDAELPRVDLELLHLLRRRIDRDGHAAEHLLGARRRRVIHGRQREVRPAQLEAARAQFRVGLRRRHLVREMQVDEQDGGSIGGLGNDHVVVPDFLEHRSWLAIHGVVLVKNGVRHRFLKPKTEPVP